MKKLFTLFAAMSLIISAGAQQRAFSERAMKEYTPSAEVLKTRESFQTDRFGIFIHWGVYSMIGHGEWVLEREQLNGAEYAKLASAFYPNNFDAAKWVGDFKAAGAKYITFTSRHHDGFSMFHTSQSDYNIVDATPFKRDILKELADECHRQGLKINIYYSLLDWYRDDYPRGESGRKTGRPGALETDETYFEFMKAQITELLTNYGEISCIWFDGHWDQKNNPYFYWHYDEIYELIHRLQPNCMVGNNHHKAIFTGEDMQIFEQDVPGKNTAGYSPNSVISQDVPLETCKTMNHSWGYNIQDQDYMSVNRLIKYIAETAGRDANLLLNVGPQPNGEIPAQALANLAKMGEWLDQFGESIYGTRARMLSPQPWGVVTHKDNRIFVHIFPDDLMANGYRSPSVGGDGKFFLAITGIKAKSVKVMADGKPLKFKNEEHGIRIDLGEVPDVADYIVELNF